MSDSNVNLANPDCEPTDKELEAIMRDVATVALAKAKVAHNFLFKNIAKSIKKPTSGMRHE